MSQFVCVKDYEKQALKVLTPLARDYYKDGAGEEHSLKWNREAFTKIRILPRMLRDVTEVDISTTILGEKISMPLGIAPTALQRMAHPDGECANAKAAEAAGTIFTLSTISTSSIEEVAAAAPKAIKWLQLYVFIDRKLTLELVHRAEKSGFKALVLTVDAPTFGDRRNELRNKFNIPSHLKYANVEDYANRNNIYKKPIYKLFDPSLSWEDVSWLKSQTRLPLIIKGILTVEDAVLSVKYGASAIQVSNHGARQIDGVPASIEVLPEIVKAVGDKLEIYIDGGITQGTDVFKALALGAKMAFIGRPMLWALACSGEKGAKDLLNILRREIFLTFALSEVMSDLVCIDDYEKQALKLLTPNVRDFFKGGSGEEDTLKSNREAFKKIRILPRMLKDVRKVDIGTTILGERISMPLGIAPTSLQQLAHPDGELANVKAAEAAGIIYTLSTLSSVSIEEVSRAAPAAIKWFQLYVLPDRKITLDLVRRAEKNGFKALVLTVDTPIVGNRRSELKNNFTKPTHVKFANFENYTVNNELNNDPYCMNLDSSLSWDDVSWLKRNTHLPIVVKGILTVEDALLSIEHGVSAILISNHGGRQMDGAPATIEVLPEIVKAVGERVEIYIDGGISQGADVFKSLALGAKMALFGRPMLWALACGGQQGAKNILEIMRRDIFLTFSLSGCRSVTEVTKNMVCHESRFSRL